MFGLKIDLAELAQQSSELASAMEARLKELEGKVPDLREYMARLSASFEETPFIPLDDVWERELGDLL